MSATALCAALAMLALVAGAAGAGAEPGGSSWTQVLSGHLHEADAAPSTAELEALLDSMQPLPSQGCPGGLDRTLDLSVEGAAAAVCVLPSMSSCVIYTLGTGRALQWEARLLAELPQCKVRPRLEPAACARPANAGGMMGTVTPRPSRQMTQVATCTPTPLQVHTFACGSDTDGPPAARRSLDRNLHFVHDECLGPVMSGTQLPYHKAAAWLGHAAVHLLVAGEQQHGRVSRGGRVVSSSARRCVHAARNASTRSPPTRPPRLPPPPPPTVCPPLPACRLWQRAPAAAGHMAALGRRPTRAAADSTSRSSGSAGPGRQQQHHPAPG
jgi:hypothetical protein